MAEPFEIGKELRKFGETTTIRGVPRALKSQDNVLKIVWTISVAVCSAVFIWNLSKLITRYLKYEFSTVTTEGKGNAIFPDVTICNVYPLGNVDSELTWSDYVKNTEIKFVRYPYEQMRANFDEYNLTKDDYDYVWESMMTPWGYFSSLPAVDGNNSKQLIRDCSAFDWDWTYNSDFECLDNIVAHWDPSYYKCYTIRIPTDINQNLRALTAIVHVNNSNPTSIYKFDASPQQSLATGARVVVHASGTMPDMKYGVTIPPGVESTVSITANKRTRLSEPWNTCSKQIYIDEEDDITYSDSACIDVCAQEQVIEACGCVLGSMQFTSSQMLLTNYTLCGNQTGNDDGKYLMNGTAADELLGFKSLLCTFYNQLNWDKCYDECDAPCSEYIYDQSVSTSGAWPHKSYLDAFYSYYVNETFQSSDQPLTDDQIKEIRSNYLQLNIVFNRMSPYEVKDVAAMTPEILWSSLGGVLSMWLGITVMTSVEFVELIYTLISTCYRKRPTAAAAAAVDPNYMTKR